MCRPRAVGGPLSGNGPARQRRPQTCRGACATNPCPSCRGSRSFCGGVSVSRPIEGLDSLGAVRTLRMKLLRANSASRLPMSSRTRASALSARDAVVRGVRTAPRLSRPSMGRDTLTLPNHERSPRQGKLGSVSPAPRHVGGHRRRAGPAPESGPHTARGLQIASRPADTGRSGRVSDARGAGETDPSFPCRRRSASQQPPARSAGEGPPMRPASRI